MEKGLPGAFDDTISALSLCRSGDDLELVVVDPPEALSPNEFGVEVRVESAGEVADI